GDEERVDTGIIRRTKSGTDETVRPNGIAITIHRQRVARFGRASFEMIRSLIFDALLLAEGGDDARCGLEPIVIERRMGARDLPKVVGEAHGVAEGIDLPFAFSHATMHLGFVMSCPSERRIAGIARERVRIAVDLDEPRVAANHTFEKPSQGGIVLGERKVGPHLRGGVAEPHRINIAGNDVGVRLALKTAWKDGGVQRVWKAMLKYPSQFRAAGRRAHLGDCVLDNRRAKTPSGHRRAARKARERMTCELHRNKLS